MHQGQHQNGVQGNKGIHPYAEDTLWDAYPTGAEVGNGPLDVPLTAKVEVEVNAGLVETIGVADKSCGVTPTPGV